MCSSDLIVTVSDEFVRDHDESRIAVLLNQWGVAALLKANSDRAALVTSDGIQLMRRP